MRSMGIYKDNSWFPRGTRTWMALDAKTGKMDWDTKIADYAKDGQCVFERAACGERPGHKLETIARLTRLILQLKDVSSAHSTSRRASWYGDSTRSPKAASRARYVGRSSGYVREGARSLDHGKLRSSFRSDVLGHGAVETVDEGQSRG